MVVHVTNAGDTSFASDLAMAIATGSGAIVLERLANYCEGLDEPYFGGERVLRITSVESVSSRQMNEGTAKFLLGCSIDEAPPILTVSVMNGESYDCLNIRLMVKKEEVDVDLIAKGLEKVSVACKAQTSSTGVQTDNEDVTETSSTEVQTDNEDVRIDALLSSRELLSALEVDWSNTFPVPDAALHPVGDQYIFGIAIDDPGTKCLGASANPVAVALSGWSSFRPAPLLRSNIDEICTWAKAFGCHCRINMIKECPDVTMHVTLSASSFGPSSIAARVTSSSAR